MLPPLIEGKLAREAGYRLPLCVLRSAAGYYLGTFDEEGPVSRESVEFWPTEAEAFAALQDTSGRSWIQREAP